MTPIEATVIAVGAFVLVWGGSGYLDPQRSARCVFGIHNYGEPGVVNTLTLSGERTEDGWEHDTSGPSKEVREECSQCHKYKERPDLDPENHPWGAEVRDD